MISPGPHTQGKRTRAERPLFKANENLRFSTSSRIGSQLCRHHAFRPTPRLAYGIWGVWIKVGVCSVVETDSFTNTTHTHTHTHSDHFTVKHVSQGSRWHHHRPFCHVLRILSIQTTWLNKFTGSLPPENGHISTAE
jgi:hypothetical protein